MKKIIFILLFLSMTVSAQASFLGMVDRTSTRDSLSIPFYLADSVGNHVDLASGDSVYVAVFSPGGTIVFKDSMAYNDGSIKSYDWEDYSGTHYAYMEQVSVLDGSSTSDGVFTVQLTAQDLTGAALTTTFMHTFQIINSTFDALLDSAGIAAVNSSKALDSLADLLDSLESMSTWMQDSLYAVIDSLQNQDNWIARQVEVSGMNGWTPITDNDSLIVDNSSISGISVSSVVTPTDTTESGYEIALRSDSLSFQGASCISSSGAFSYSFITYDSSVSQTISDINVAVRNLTQTSLIASGRTDINGSVSFNLDADSFLVTAAASGYTFSTFDTVIVSADAVDTVFGTQFDPGAPSSADLCRVWGFVYDINSQPEQSASVTASLPAGVVTFNNTIVSPLNVSTSTDATGYFYLDLIPSADLSPIDRLYEFTISLSNGTILRQRLTVPDTTSWQLIW